MTLLDYALRLVGEIAERPGTATHPFIAWCHESTLGQNQPDEVPWCSSFVNRCAWHLRLPRSKSAMARSWLNIGTSITLYEAKPGYDVVIFSRGAPPSGHVAIFAGLDGDSVRVCGGNQSNGVSIANFQRSAVLGVRRLKQE